VNFGLAWLFDKLEINLKNRHLVLAIIVVEDIGKAGRSSI